MTAANGFAAKIYSKLLFRTIGPFWITVVGKHTSTIDEDGIVKTISIDRTIRVPTPSDLLNLVSDTRERKIINVKDTNNAAVQSAIAQQPGDTPNIQHFMHTKSQLEHIPNPREYVMGRIVQHIGKPPEVKYIVYWDGYYSSNDSVDRPKNLPVHFLVRKWRKLSKRSNLFGLLICLYCQGPPA